MLFWMVVTVDSIKVDYVVYILTRPPWRARASIDWVANTDLLVGRTRIERVVAVVYRSGEVSSDCWSVRAHWLVFVLI